MDLTIIIPTKNRNFFLEKNLSYYSKQLFKGNIIIADSSDHEYLEENTKIVQSFKNINITHKYIFGVYFDVLSKVMPMVKTKYVVCSGDDDYFVIEALSESIDFLEKKNDFIAVHGLGVLLRMDEKNHNKILHSVPYHIPAYLNNTAKERLKNFSSNKGVLNFSVHRSDVFKKVCVGKLDSFEKEHDLDEYLNSMLSVVYGKIGQTSRISIVRTFVPSAKTYVVPISGFLNSKNYKKNFDFFSNELSKALSKVDNISFETSKKIIFSKYNKLKVFKHTRLNNLLSSLNNFFRRIKNKVIYRNNFKLKNLLSKRSKFHKDFFPIFQSITEYRKK